MRRLLSVLCVVANACTRIVSDILVKERFSGICAETAHTGFHATKIPDYRQQTPFSLFLVE